jgi:hypothetical protein
MAAAACEGATVNRLAFEAVLAFIALPGVVGFVEGVPGTSHACLVHDNPHKVRP